jgi:divalent metal cation (Fe/Co/Zn/Cd) transporter
VTARLDGVSQTVQLTEPRRRSIPSGAQRERLERRARLLAWSGIGWHFIEFGIALGAGLAAGSIALVGFGADSLIEAWAGFVVVWLFTGARRTSHTAERRAQQLIAGSFFILAAYVGVEAIRDLAGAHHPSASWVGVGQQLNSSATVKEGAQNMLCAYLSVALLIGLMLNATAGWWWADPGAALVIAGVAFREGVESWRGEGCCDTR